MWPNIAMLAGFALWLTGELWGVRRDAERKGGHTPDTTSGWVWLTEKKWPITRAAVFAFIVWLGVHFLSH